MCAILSHLSPLNHLSKSFNVRLYSLYWQYAELLYFDLYLYSAYAADYVYICCSSNFRKSAWVRCIKAEVLK